MKKIFQIAANELKVLFFSPVAWFILIIFTIQSFTAFTSSLGSGLRSLEMGWGVMGYGVTEGVYTNSMFGYLPNVLQYLYLYIPLLTMGLMSREFGSGSIKLLYSSPISNLQIILGKYAAVVVYGLLMMLVLLVQMVFGIAHMPNFDTSAILTALFGMFLLTCCYAAIGLFMSCLTAYQVVAAILTLAMLAVLNMVGNWGQNYELMREVTYWLALNGRVNTFLEGLICSEDVLYFLIVICLFLTLSIIKLNANRQKSKFSASALRYLGVIAVACVLGAITAQPKMKLYHDSTATQRNTLTQNSQDIVSKLGDETLKITVYDNGLDLYDIWTGLPGNRMHDRAFWNQYLRFKPDITLDYVLYYDSIPGQPLSKQFPEKELPTLEAQLGEVCRIYGDIDSTMFITPDSIHSLIDLSGEKMQFVRELECSNGRKTFLRVFDDMIHVPTEAEITAAIKRLVMELPVVGFAQGQGERDYKGISDRDYNFAVEPRFRAALFNQGFDVREVNFAQAIPDTVQIVVIGEMKRPFNEEEQLNFDQYIARGGNLLVITEPRRRTAMNYLLQEFGVRQDSGVLVHEIDKLDPSLTLARPTREVADRFWRLDILGKPENCITMPSCAPLSYDGVAEKGYECMPLLYTDSLYWNEMQTTDFVDDSAHYEPATGEVMKQYATALALNRKVGDREQKIIILPDADCLSNNETTVYRRGVEGQNFALINAMFYWMSDDEVPIDVRRPDAQDTKIELTKQSLEAWKYVLHWAIPIAMLLVYLLIWLRRRNR